MILSSQHQKNSNAILLSFITSIGIAFAVTTGLFTYSFTWPIIAAWGIGSFLLTLIVVRTLQHFLTSPQAFNPLPDHPESHNLEANKNNANNRNEIDLTQTPQTNMEARSSPANDVICLWKAVKQNDAHDVDKLLRAGARLTRDKNSNLTILDWAVKKGAIEVVRVILSHPRSRYLLNSMAGVESIQESPLHIAASLNVNHTSQQQKKRLEILKLLLAQPSILLEGQDSFDCTPLHLAAESNNSAAISLLIEKGANINAVTIHHNSPLHLALKHINDPKAAIELLKCPNIDFDLKNQQNKTPLDIAKCSPELYSLTKQMRKQIAAQEATSSQPILPSFPHTHSTTAKTVTQRTEELPPANRPQRKY